MRPPAPDGVELGRGVEARLVGLHEPEEPVALEVPARGQPAMVPGDRRLGSRVPDCDSPCPGEQRRLDRARHRGGARGDVVVDAALKRDRPLPEDHVADEAVRAGGAQQSLELRPRPRRVEATPDDRREARVPVPLPWIAPGARAGVGVGNPVPLALGPACVEHAMAEPWKRSCRRSAATWPSRWSGAQLAWVALQIAVRRMPRRAKALWEAD